MTDMDVDYSFWERTEGGFFERPGVPELQEGSVQASYAWYYKCSTTGELVFYATDAKDSPTKDHFSVTVDRATQSNPQPKGSILPYVVMTARPMYAGQSPGAGMPVPTPKGIPPVTLQRATRASRRRRAGRERAMLVASLPITNLPPPPPPPPPPNFSAMETIIPFGKEGQTSLDDKARRIASDWVQTLFQTYPLLEAPMMRGDINVYFTGYASKTGKAGATTEQISDDFNLEIGEARAKSAVDYLRPSLGSGAKTSYKSRGRQIAQWAKKFDPKLHQMVEVVGKPRDVDRFVLVWVDEDDVKRILKK